MFVKTNMKKQNALIHDGVKALDRLCRGILTPSCRNFNDSEPCMTMTISTFNQRCIAGWVEAMLATVAEHDPAVTSHTQTAWREVLTPGIDLMASLY